MNKDRATNPPTSPGPHLSDETLSELASGTLSENARIAATRHAETCEECAQALRDYMALTTALRSMPAPRPRRMFQLTEEQARSHSKRRWGFPWLTPSLPALRAATLAVALLLVVVAGADRLTRPGGNSSNVEQFTAMTAPTATALGENLPPTRVIAAAVLPTKAAVVSGAAQTTSGANTGAAPTATAESEAPAAVVPAEVGAAAPGAASGSGSAAGVTSASESSADSATGGSSSINHEAVAKAVASPTPTSTPTPTPSPTATTTASPTATATTTPTPQPTAPPVAVATTSGGSGSSRTGWRIAELGLALLLLWLVVTYAGAWRTARNRR